MEVHSSLLEQAGFRMCLTASTVLEAAQALKRQFTFYHVLGAVMQFKEGKCNNTVWHFKMIKYCYVEQYGKVKTLCVQLILYCWIKGDNSGLKGEIIGLYFVHFFI